MVMTIRNTCRMFDNLFRLVGNREMKNLNSPYISVGGFEPASVVYIEVSNIENFSMWVFSQQRLMAGSKILKGEKVYSIRVLGVGVGVGVGIFDPTPTPKVQLN